MRTALLACLLVVSMPRIAAACDDADVRVSEMTERLLARIEALEERLSMFEVDVEAEVDVVEPDELDDPPDIDVDDVDDDT